MKRFIYLLGLMMIMSFNEAAADHRTAALEIAARNGEPIMLVLDGVRQGQALSFFHVTDLRPGNHYVKVIQKRRVVEQYHTPRGYSREQVIIKKVVLFEGNIYLEPGFKTVAQISRGGGAVIKARVQLYRPRHHQGQIGRGRNGRTQGRAIGNPHNGYGQTRGRATGYSQGSCGVVTTQYVNNGACIIPHADGQQFSDIKRTILDRSFDSKKRLMAMRFIDDYHFTALQIRDIMLLMDFESSKVEIAKYAYTRMHNPGQFYLVYDAFDFNSSVDEVSRYTARR